MGSELLHLHGVPPLSVQVAAQAGYMRAGRPPGPFEFEMGWWLWCLGGQSEIRELVDGASASRHSSQDSVSEDCTRTPHVMQRSNENMCMTPVRPAGGTRAPANYSTSGIAPCNPPVRSVGAADFLPGCLCVSGAQIHSIVTPFIPRNRK